MAFWLKIKNFFKATHPVGGLAISDGAARFMTADGLLKAGVGFSPGIVTGGKVTDPEKLLEALIVLHKRVAAKDEKVSVILSVSPQNVITDNFSIPPVEDPKKMEEAANYNLSVAAPFDLKNAYYDGQKLEGLDFLGAFVKAEIIDGFLAIVRRAGFFPVAVEFPALSFSRLFPAYGLYAAAMFSEDGVDFLVMKDRNLYFSRFLGWAEAAQNYEWAVEAELKRIFALDGKKFARKFDGILIAAPEEAAGRLCEKLEKDFGIKTRLFAPPMNLQLNWYAAAGAAIRGLLPRHRDHFISLAPLGTEDEYWRERTKRFFIFWRNAAVLGLGAILTAFLITDSLFLKKEVAVKDALAKGTARPDIEELLNLQGRAREFNRLVSLAAAVEGETVDWESFFSKIEQLAGSQISLDRIFVLRQEKTGQIAGRAPSEVAALAFKDRLLKDALFKDAILPLSEITKSPDGKSAFSLEFTSDF